MVKPKTKFLIIDDSLSMRKILAHILTQLGYTNIVQAKDGEQAYDALLENFKKKEPIEFIISDWNLPKMTGLEFLKKCRTQKDFQTIPFLLVTAENDQDKISKALKEGITDFVIKPFSPALLKAKLEKYIT